jgi:hypothetical protein
MLLAEAWNLIICIYQNWLTSNGRFTLKIEVFVNSPEMPDMHRR